MNCRAGFLRVMDIDPGLTRCGLSIAEDAQDRKVIPITVRVARTPATTPSGDRLLRSFNVVEQWMDEYGPDVIAMERVFGRGNVSTVMQAAYAVDVLVLATARHSLEVYMYTPSEVKKALIGDGQADKKQMTMMATRILGSETPPKPVDVTDALAIAICHCWRDPVLRHQRDTLAALVKQRKERGLELSRRENSSWQGNLPENSCEFGINRDIFQESRNERSCEK